YGDAQRTAAAFMQNPLNSNYRDLIYRTGDIAKYNERGEIIFLGRKDHQIKHMGHRIELGEIETTALALPEIESCCAVYDDERKKILLLCLTRNDTEHDGKGIYRQLKQKLPPYMLPHQILFTDEMPLSANGKIDRKKVSARLIN